MTLEGLPDWAKSQLDRARVARLAFADEDARPRVLPVTFALAEGAIWSAIDHKPKRTAEPARVRWLRRDPRAALIVDHDSDNWDELTWVQLVGRIAVLAIADGPAGRDALIGKYPQYRDRPPPGPLLRLDVERALCWRASD